MENLCHEFVPAIFEKTWNPPPNLCTLYTIVKLHGKEVQSYHCGVNLMNVASTKPEAKIFGRGH
jgi:hypothetical protein